MALDTTHARLAPVIDRLHPYLGGLLAKGGELALRLHADVVTTVSC